MKCISCDESLPDDSLFCFYCGAQVAHLITSLDSNIGNGDTEEGFISEKQRDEITESQRYFDLDFGYSEENPLVVSSVSMIGYYLMAFRTPEGKSFTWKREPKVGDSNIDRYSLHIDGELYSTVFFNPHGKNTSHLPHGLGLDEGAFDAAKRGLNQLEYQSELKAKEEIEDRIKIEEEKRLEEERIAAEEEEHARLIREQEMAATEANRQRLAEIAAAEKAEKLQRIRKILIKSLLAVIIISILIVSLLTASRMLKYTEANEQLKSGNYTESITLFADLGDYKESLSYLNEAYYLYGIELEKSGRFREAISCFENVGNYKDSEDLKVKCIFKRAVEKFNEGDYIDAYKSFSEISTYEGVSEYYADSAFLVAKDYYKFGDLDNAFKYCIIFERIEDRTSDDTSFIYELKYQYANKLIETKESSNITKAISILNEIQQTTDVAELISKGNNQFKQNQYDIGMDYFTKAEYEKAVNVFMNIKEFADAKTIWYESMYKYVSQNTTRNNVTTYRYLKELTEAMYSDSISIYNELYAWEAFIVMNNDPEARFVPLVSVSKYSNIYAHINLTGGAPGESTTLKYSFTLPNGSIVSGNFDGEWSNGDSGTCYCYYDYPEYGSSGTCYVRIYDSVGNTIGKEQIRVTN